jgi:hypothetical protein
VHSPAIRLTTLGGQYRRHLYRGTHRIAVLREHWAMVTGSSDANDGDAGDANEDGSAGDVK